MTNWDNFFVATAGAAATLTGLIFVGISISLNKIISDSSLTNRAFISLVLLLSILILSILFLVPDQSPVMLGGKVLFIGIVVWLIIIYNDIRILKKKNNEYRKMHLFNALLDQIAVVPYLIVGVLMIFGTGPTLQWVVTAVVFSFVKAVLDAWVLLVEINR